MLGTPTRWSRTAETFERIFRWKDNPGAVPPFVHRDPIVIELVVAKWARTKSGIWRASCWPSASRFTTKSIFWLESANWNPLKIAAPRPIFGPSITLPISPSAENDFWTWSLNSTSDESSTTRTSNWYSEASKTFTLSAISSRTKRIVSRSPRVAKRMAPFRPDICEVLLFIASSGYSVCSH